MVKQRKKETGFHRSVETFSSVAAQYLTERLPRYIRSNEVSLRSNPKKALGNAPAQDEEELLCYLGT